MKSGASGVGDETGWMRETYGPQDSEFQNVQGVLDGRFVRVVGRWPDERRPVAAPFLWHLDWCSSGQKGLDRGIQAGKREMPRRRRLYRVDEQAVVRRVFGNNAVSVSRAPAPTYPRKTRYLSTLQKIALKTSIAPFFVRASAYLCWRPMRGSVDNERTTRARGAA